MSEQLSAEDKIDVAIAQFERDLANMSAHASSTCGHMQAYYNGAKMKLLDVIDVLREIQGSVSEQVEA